MVWPEIMLGATIPLTLVAGQRVIADLLLAIKAKRALEAEIFSIAQAEHGARTVLEVAATSETQALDALELVERGAARLSPEYYKPVRKALRSSHVYPNAIYIQDIARHVGARLHTTA